MSTSVSQTDDMNENVKAHIMNFEHFPCGIAIIKNDAFSTIIEANPAFYKIIGYTEKQFWEKHCNRMKNIVIDYYDEIAEPHTPGRDYDFKWDLRIRRADGSIAWIQDLTHYNAQLDVFVLIYTDITDKMIVESSDLSYEAFQIKNNVLLHLSEYTTKHFIVTDLETDKVMYMNTAAMQLLGFRQESDWQGKTYLEIAFGSAESVRLTYYEPLTDEFKTSEYYNEFHKKYVRVEEKMVIVPALKRKMRLSILTNITAQKRLERKMEAQKTLRSCIEVLFTTGTTGNASEDAYCEILNQMKTYYRADRAFFYKFKSGTYEVENFLEVSADGLKKVELKLPAIVTEQQVQAMQKLTTAKIVQVQTALDAFGGDYKLHLMQAYQKYQINTFACIAVNDSKENLLAFMGVTNPQTHEDTKGMMDLLSRSICMFIEYKEAQLVKEETLALEASSKKKLVEKCVKNFQSITHSKENIIYTLDALCSHYDADFAIIVSRTENGTYGVTYMSDGIVPDMSGLQQSGNIMGSWLATFEKHTHFASDLDFDDIDAPMVKKILQEKYGIYNFVASPMRNANGSLAGLLIVSNLNFINRSHLMVHVVAKDIFDYLERIKMHQKNQLEPLTKLVNKIETEKQISRVLEDGENGTLFIIDIDNFKGLNDTVGHQFGDHVIVKVAGVLKQLFRVTDIIGRVGGDEFMVFSPGLVSNDLIVKKANQLLDMCHEHYEQGGLTTEISISIGIYCVDDSDSTFDTIYTKADCALYQSKKDGRNQYHIYTPAEPNLEHMRE